MVVPPTGSWTTHPLTLSSIQLPKEALMLTVPAMPTVAVNASMVKTHKILEMRISASYTERKS
jgi:hypothetical protein